VKNRLFSCRPASPCVLSVLSKVFFGKRGIASLAFSSLIPLALALISAAAQAQSCTGYTTKPLVSVPSGSYTVAQMVTLSDPQPGAVIYYTTNGEAASSNQTTPSPNATLYTAPFEVSTTTQLSVIALAPGYCINYFPAGSNIVFLSPAQDFSISVSPSTLSVDVGKTATATITVTPTNGFDSQIGFSCSGASQVICGFTPLLVTPSGTSTNVQLSVVGAPVAALHKNSQPLLPATALAGILCIFGLRRWRRLRLMMVTMVALASLGLLSSCGGSGSTPVSPGTITVTATMTDVTVSTLQHTATLSVN